MPRPSKRSTSLRKIKKKLPGGRLTVHYTRRKPSHTKCGNCGKALLGVPRQRPKKLKKISKAGRRPERPYGGTLCSPCTRALLIARVRNGAK